MSRSSDGKGSEEEDASFYDHKEAYANRRLILAEFATDTDSATSLSESTNTEYASESSESGHSSHRGGGGNNSSGGRRRKRKKVTIRYTTKSAAEGGDGRRTLLAGTLKRMVEWLIEKEVRPLKRSTFIFFYLIYFNTNFIYSLINRY